MKKPYLYEVLRDIYYGLRFKLIRDEKLIISNYKKVFGKVPNLTNPKTFNEKISWRKLNSNNLLLTRLSDKYLVREYVKETIGEQYLIKLLGVYKDASEIDYHNLPKKFVLKCNHDSGSAFIIKDKNSIDTGRINKSLNRYLRRCYYSIGRERHYKGIKPIIICEEFIGNEDKAPNDYKFHILKNASDTKIFVQYDMDRFTNHQRAMMDEEWKPAGFSYKKESPPNFPPKPESFELMKKLALKLSEGLDMARVDFYEVNGQVLFGEITFTSESGLGKFTPEHWDAKLGEYWEIKS